MIYFLIFIPIAVLLVAFQAAVLNPLTVAGGHLDILLISLVLLTLYGSLELALIGVVIMAPLVDALAGMPLGISILPMTSMVLLAYWGGKTIFGTRLGWPILVVFAGTFLAGAITLAELAIIGWDMPWNELIVRTLIPTAILNTIGITAIYLPITLFNEHRELKL